MIRISCIALAAAAIVVGAPLRVAAQTGPAPSATGAPAPAPAKAKARASTTETAESAKANNQAKDEDAKDAEAEAKASNPTKRRGGFMVCLSMGSMLGRVTGYPNDATKIDRERYHTDTGTFFTSSTSLVLGGAFTDYFSFGIGVTGGRTFFGDYLVKFGGANFQIDTYPFWALGGVGENLGIGLLAGMGFVSAELDEDDAEVLIESGGASRLGLWVFWEGIKFWRISMGPFVAADFIWSQSAFRPAGWFGWRTALYTRQP